MPGGKITENHNLPDLESFLVRKRYPLNKWLTANQITSPEAFKSLISSNKWNISSEMQHIVFELLKPVFVPSVVVEAPEVAVQTIAIISEPVVVSPPPEEPVVEQQEVFTVEEPVVSVPEEPVQPVEEVSLVSSHSFKERKKSR